MLKIDPKTLLMLSTDYTPEPHPHLQQYNTCFVSYISLVSVCVVGGMSNVIYKEIEKRNGVFYMVTRDTFAIYIIAHF